MIVHIDRLIKHLQTQIHEAKKVKSEWVYITLPQAEKCLELAEAEDVIMDMLNAQPDGEVPKIGKRKERTRKITETDI